eukprot:c19854_g1_i1 orf=3-908(-)
MSVQDCSAEPVTPAALSRVTSSTFDLLHWSDSPSAGSIPPSPARISATNDSSAFMRAANQSACDDQILRTAIRTQQPAGGVSTINFGADLTPQEAEALQKRRPASETKRREMSGTGIFVHDTSSDSPLALCPDKLALRVKQPAGGAPQISFGVDAVSLKKPTSLPGVVKQRELSGTLETDEETPVRRPCSSAKARELAGSNIFGLAVDPRSGCLRHAFEEHQPNRGTPETIPRVGRGCVKVLNAAGGDGQELLSRKGHDQKVAELSGNNIFETECPIVASEKFVSVAKLKEMSGSDIFADEK